MYGIATVALLAGLASAKNCKNISIPITASARNGVFNIPEPASNIDVTNFILDNTQQDINYTDKILQGYKTVGGKYHIEAQYCEPDSGASDVLQVLTHGIGFDKTYWDAAYNNYNYSYVDEAVDQYGYSTFAWDRLGISQSSHGDPLNEIQALLEVDALRYLTVGLRNGTLSGIKPAYNKIVHVGHSFGSEHTYALTAMYPTISDGIVLTGFSQNGSFVPFFALGGNFVQASGNPKFKTLPNGYLAASDTEAVQTNFFAPGDFDPKIVEYAFSIGYPVTTGELLTIGGETGSVNKFAGPVLIITGARDVPYCGGNCLAPPTGFPNIPSTSKANFPEAKSFTVDIVPGAGHGLNLQYSARYTYGKILDFFAQNGLAGSHGGSYNGTDNHTTSSGW